ncbi:AAA domain-containing protein [uncultured Cloacibacillus sp.]|uniref:AAA domain-containing protein n=1 Tax=uncultured Cloacibacillus sp. TaxID=889794 RepID=UPI0026DB1F3D|nr:AAA domain-containing protein [uncultured Cloacibacillus sp.]
MDKVKGLISIFNFIKEMNKLKYMTAKNIQEQIWHCFISDIPTDSTDVVLTDWQGIQDTADNEERIILWIKKPNFPICPQPPKSIIEWLEPGWDKYDTQVRYKKSLPGVSKEQIINFTDDEKREKDFQQWIKEREEWQKEYNKIRIVRNLFVELYNRYIDLGKSPDTIEFLCGSGLIRDKRNPHISHPILLKRCQIKFEAADNIIKICDTDVEPQICTEVLSFIDEINSDKVGVYQNRLQEESIHPFDKQNATKFLRELTHELCAESEFFDNNNANSKERITVVFSPTFFIRKRIDGAVRATEKVIAAIENKGEIPHHLLELPEASSQRILPTDYEEPDISRKLAALNGESTEILLSKEANSEQLQIAERIAKEDAVIVQGPPGTGKTHTIANLIGHFLAEGKSILVTSHTRKALSVLKEKLPKELQGLCVSILEDSNRDMERSIDSITDYMSKHSYAELKRKADSMRNERLDIVKRLSALRMKIYMEKRKECEPIVLDGESYSVSDAADFIRKNSERLVYYIPGEVKVNQSIPMSKSDLHYLYESNGILTPEIEHELSCNLPSPDTLPTPEAFDEEVSQRKEYEVTLAKLSSEMNIPLSFDCANNSIVGNGNTIIKNPSYSTLTELETLSKKIPSFTDWQIQAAADGRQNSMSRTEWENLVSAIERFANYEKAAVPALMGKTVTLGQYDSYLQQARSLLNDLRGHDGKIGWFTKFSNADLVRIHESVRINGAQISSAKDCDIALKFVELTEIRRYLEISWNKLMAYNGCPEFSHLGSDASNFCMNKLQEIRNYLNWYTTGYAELYKSIVDAGINDSLLFNLTGMESGAEMTQKIIDVVHKRIFTFIEAGRSLLHIAEIDKENKKLQQTLSSGDRKESRIC